MKCYKYCGNVTEVKCIFKVYEMPFLNASKHETILGKAIMHGTVALAVVVACALVENLF